jgi:hypothetical protein
LPGVTFLLKSEETLNIARLLPSPHYGHGNITKHHRSDRQKIALPKNWTQAMLTARCARAGWDISENTVAKIEAQIRCVTDQEIVYLTRALGVGLEDIFPADQKTRKTK